MEELAEELEEQRELATNTLQELEALNIKYRENLKKVEELQMNVSCLLWIFYRSQTNMTLIGNLFLVETFTGKCSCRNTWVQMSSVAFFCAL